MIEANQFVRIASKRHSVAGALCLHVFSSAEDLAPLLAMTGRTLRRRIRAAAWFAYEDSGQVIDFIGLLSKSGEWYEADGRHLTIEPV